jgi:hypothetical protein
MKSFLVFADYDSKYPVGRVMLDESVVPVDNFPDCVLAPLLLVDQDNEKFELKSFGLIKRDSVDTRPRNEIGRQ